MVNYINLIIEMSPRFVLGRENVPCVAEVVNRSLKADCTDSTFADFYETIIIEMRLFLSLYLVDPEMCLNDVILFNSLRVSSG